ncbi:MAG: hypothetical protein ACP5JP_01990 [bacterium]
MRFKNLPKTLILKTQKAKAQNRYKLEKAKQKTKNITKGKASNS